MTVTSFYAHPVMSNCFATLWAVAHQAPLSMEFSRQEYWSGLPCPSPGDLPDPGIEPVSPVSPALAGGFFTSVPPGKLPSRDTRYSLVVIQNVYKVCITLYSKN